MIFFLIGLILVLPCIDVFVKVDLRTITCNIPPQEVVLIKDMSLEIKGVFSLLYGPLQLYSTLLNYRREGELSTPRDLLELPLVIPETTKNLFCQMRMKPRARGLRIGLV